MLLIPASQRRLRSRFDDLPMVVLLLGCAVLMVPTMVDLARLSWTTEQGGHGPIVLATGIWLLVRELKASSAVRRPGNGWLGFTALSAMLLIYVAARITGVLEIEAFAMYGALLAAFYLIVGGAVLRSIWFPLVYLAFTLPPPDTAVAAITQPIKIAISGGAVALLHALGYPIASSGVVIQIAQYELLVAAACAGLNSLITLAAICLFYVYMRHRSNPRAFAIIGLSVIPIAIFSNFVRVLVLILITYHFGDAAAQGFIHDFAGLLMFAVAIAAAFAIDAMFSRFISPAKAAA